MSEHSLSIEVEVELYPGLLLAGNLSCKVQYDPRGEEGRPSYLISEHSLTVSDKDHAHVPVDFEDLRDIAQDKINDQVIAHYSAPAEAAA